MSDRIVRKISPREGADPLDRVWRYSDFSDVPNIVLVGDPGAGKSHLLKEAATAANGRLLNTRDFLNNSTIQLGESLFIDALDEKRAGRNDQATVDEVVKKLFQLQPRQVRIR